MSQLFYSSTQPHIHPDKHLLFIQVTYAHRYTYMHTHTHTHTYIYIYIGGTVWGKSSHPSQEPDLVARH